MWRCIRDILLIQIESKSGDSNICRSAGRNSFSINSSEAPSMQRNDLTSDAVESHARYQITRTPSIFDPPYRNSVLYSYLHQAKKEQVDVLWKKVWDVMNGTLMSRTTKSQKFWGNEYGLRFRIFYVMYLRSYSINE